MDDFDQLWVWDDPATDAALGWYHAVAANRMPAKFRIAATFPVTVALGRSPEHALWAELDRLTPRFLTRWRDIRAGSAILGSRANGDSLLELCAELVRRMLAHCNFCAWDCQVDRSRAAKFGACKLASETRVSSFFHHRGEELVYRGEHGSGTIFFTSCNMRCAFCQNGDISTERDNGTPVTARTLAAMAWLLRMEGCHNINWVGGDPAIHLHTIVEAIALLGGGMAAPDHDELAWALSVKADRLRIADFAFGRGKYEGSFNVPMLWNSNLFLSDEAMKILRLLMDVWIPDFKFGPGRCSITLARTARYWETVTRLLTQIHDWHENLTIRHLVMPNHVECCTYPVIDWLAENMPAAPVNIMNQYRPENFCDPQGKKYRTHYAAVSRRPTGEEIRLANAHARERGLNFEAITYERTQRGLHA